MKKLLVVLMAAVMVLSVAAVSLAAVTVKGDFRYDMYQDETASDESYANADLRFNFSGSLSDTLDASATVKIVHDDGKDRKDADKTTDVTLDEFFVNYKQSWGSVKAGYYEYKFTPSRVLLKSGHYHVWEKSDVVIATTFNLIGGLTADLIVQPYQQNIADDGAYGVSLNYAADKWGAKVTYADFLAPAANTLNVDDDLNLIAFDAYYKINDNMKVFVTAVDYSANDKKDAAYVDGEGDNSSIYAKNGIDGIDPVIGFSWDKIAGTKLFAAVEYAINPRYEDTAAEYNEATLNLKYKFNNNTGLEIEHYIVGDGVNKTMYRLRYQF